MPDRYFIWPNNIITAPFVVQTTTTATNDIVVWPSATPISMFSAIACYATNPAIVMATWQREAMNQALLANQAQALRQQNAAERERRDYAATEAARVIAPNREAALMRARELLLQHLNEEQRRTFIEYKWFVVEGGRSKRRYRIKDQGNVVANVDALDLQDRVIVRLCAHGRHDYQLPLYDQLLTQKIMLELDEDSFLRVANHH